MDTKLKTICNIAPLNIPNYKDNHCNLTSVILDDPRDKNIIIEVLKVALYGVIMMALTGFAL